MDCWLLFSVHPASLHSSGSSRDGVYLFSPTQMGSVDGRRDEGWLPIHTALPSWLGISYPSQADQIDAAFSSQASGLRSQAAWLRDLVPAWGLPSGS